MRKALTALRRLPQWCDIHGYSVLNPGLIGLPKHEKRDIKFLTPTEVRDFIDVVKMPRLNLTEQARLRNVAICEVLFASGIRVSELVKLDRNSIKNKVFNVSGKSKYSRECYINDRAEKALDEYLATRVDNCTLCLYLRKQMLECRTSPCAISSNARVWIRTLLECIRTRCGTRSLLTYCRKVWI